jgi:very-short-patch-repair endonuclease
MIKAEKRLWQMLRLRQIEGCRFRRQVPIDGAQHDLSSDQETNRTRFRENEGYCVLRFWNNELLDDPEGVLSVITENLHQVTPTQTLPHQGGGQEGFR